MTHSKKREKQQRPIIIAICGKSATGKDTLAKWLIGMLKINGIPVNMIVNDTTRPPRIFEKNGVDYYFLTKDEFYNKIKNKDYIEHSFFNGWFYGTDKTSIISNSVNIGIFNIDGMADLIDYQNDFEIVCIYLECGLIQRLIRSYERENSFKIEYIRRAYTDYYDFKDIKRILKYYPNQFIFDSQKTPIVSMADRIIWRLKMKNLLPPYNKSQ